MFIVSLRSTGGTSLLSLRYLGVVKLGSANDQGVNGPNGQALDRRGALVCCERARHVTDAKAAWAARRVVLVDPSYTNQCCSMARITFPLDRAPAALYKTLQFL